MNDRDLDNLLREALHADPPAEQVRRLEQFWRDQLAADRRHRRTFAIALAASLALVATGVAWLLQRTGQPQFHQQAENAAPHTVQPPQAPARNANQLADDLNSAKPLAGRAATPYEQVMFRLRIAQAAKAEATVVAMNPEATLQQLEERVGVAGLPRVAETTPHPALRTAIVRRLLALNDEMAIRSYLSLVANERTRFDALAGADQLERPPVDTFFALLHDDSKSVRITAAMVLGHINGTEVTASLIRLVTQDRAAPAEAWIALLACRDESAEQFIADAAHHPRMLGRLNNARIFWQMIQ